MRFSKFSVLTLMAVSMSISTRAQSSQQEQQTMDQFIQGLMDKMTLEEKIGQLNLPATGEIITGEAQSSNIAASIQAGKVGGLLNLKGVDRIKELQKLAVEKSRLGIPLLFGMDVIHGYETVFPIPLAMSCSWDLKGIEQSAHIAATEASADGICWTFSPMVDICRDARWGRIAEGSGEDPYLGSRIAEAMVRGYQGDMKGNDQILTCVKHFALYGAPDAGRDYNTVDMSRLRMYNEYFAPYKAAVEAGAASVMASFNTVDGIPATGNRWLMTEVLRNQWNFKGFVVTDYTGMAEMIAHGMGDLQQVSALALKAGIDMDMVSDGFLGTLAQSVKEGKVTEADIDQACRRILEAKYKAGLFENPYKYCDSKRRATDIFTAAHREAARKLARESFVLLKNEKQTLPLKKSGKIALIGPLANTRANMPGTWSVAAVTSKYSTLLEGLQKAVAGKAQILYAKGSNLMYDAQLQKNACSFADETRDSRSDEEMLKEALEVANQADIIVAALGESSEMSGECSSRTQLEMPDAQRDLLKALLKTNKPIVLLNFAGRPTVLTWEQEHIPAILNVWFGGSETADAIADVIFGDYSPSGKLTTSFPRTVGQVPIHYNSFNTGRPLAEGSWFSKFKTSYIDCPNEPLYPFGYGLSYTSFSYSPVTLSSTTLDKQGSITASVTVKNTGKYDADEIVQLYIRDLVGSIVRPVKELKGFQRIHLKQGESQTVSFEITPEQLKFYNSNLEYVYEPGEFQVMIGPNSHDVKPVSFTLK